MQKIVFLLFSLIFFASLSYGQAPGKMNYQAVVRDTSGVLITNQSIGIEITLLRGSATGTAVFTENQTGTTNENGLLTFTIGDGTASLGNLDNIDWSNGPYFIKRAFDPAGGTTYTITATSELYSVPYALFAGATSGGVTSLDGLSDAKGPGDGFTNSLLVGHENTGTLGTGTTVAASAYGNTVIGIGVLANVTSGDYNIGLGFEALKTLTTGGNNTALGTGSLGALTSGSDNIGVGRFTLGAVTNSSQNIAIGNYALQSNTGNGNIGIGLNALNSNTTASNECAVGFEAGRYNATGTGNTAIGYQSLRGTFGKNSGQNVAIGYRALYTAGTSDAVNGSLSKASQNVMVGYESGNDITDAKHSTGVGYRALTNATTGDGNTAIGKESSQNITTGYYNTALGISSLGSATTGYQNVSIGASSMYNNVAGNGNVAVGLSAGRDYSGGDNNVMIGKFAGNYNATTSPGNAPFTGSNVILIGYNAQPSAVAVSNEIVLGNGDITTLRCNTQTITSLSDRRDKKDIKTMPEGMAFVKKLKPVTFVWDQRDGGRVGIPSAGFIAQDLLELQENSPIGDHLDLVSTHNPKRLEARYNNLLPVLVKAMQEQQSQLESQQKLIEELTAQVQSQAAVLLDQKDFMLQQRALIESQAALLESVTINLSESDPSKKVAQK